MWFVTEESLPPKRIDRATVPGAPWQSVRLVNEAVRDALNRVEALRAEIRRVIVGQDCLVNRLLICLLADGHLLLETKPGMSRSRTMMALANGMNAEFRRVALSSDLRPADLTGSPAALDGTDPLTARAGPVFADVLLAEEIHRATPSVQNALLAAMEDREVLFPRGPVPLPDPFLVVATTGPSSGDRISPLTESQADRFLMKLVLDYPHSEEEREFIEVAGSGRHGPRARAVLSTEELLRARRVVASIHADRRIMDYAVSLVSATRGPGLAGSDQSASRRAPHRDDLTALIRHGASPRASVSLIRAAMACAFLAGRGYLTPGDVKAVAPDVLRHRLTLRSRAASAGITVEQVIRQILSCVAVP